MNYRLLGIYRTGTRCYTSRPPSGCRSARKAWDRLSARKEVPLVELMLIDGIWSGGYKDGTSAVVENVFAPTARKGSKEPSA